MDLNPAFNINSYYALGGGIGLLVFVFIAFYVISALRRVVNTNEVHIVQRSGTTVSYGKDTGKGNTYYEWPSWLPILGVSKVVLPVSVFKLELSSYDAYDKGRVPFEIDVVAFFRISDSNMAAQRVSSIPELKEQLLFIVKGAARTVLASYDIDTIMVERSTFGTHFTEEVHSQLTNWGVETVKNIELMDIRDGQGNQVVHNIMQKKKSLIEMQSRIEVAKNNQDASVAELNAEQEIETKRRSAQQIVGIREAEKTKTVGVAQAQAQQEITEQNRITKEKEMAVLSVAQIRQAEIDKQVLIVEAERTKQSTILVAEGNLASNKLNAEAITVEGLAKAEAEKAMQLAPVQAQITLAKEIGENKEYQEYLVTIRQLEANQAVGIAQANNLGHADIKIIANSGDVVSGVHSLGDLFTTKGGTNLAGALEALSNTPVGKALVEKVVAIKK